MSEPLCGSHQDVVDLIDAFSTDRDAVDLQDFIPLTEETALLRRPTADHPTDDHTVMIVSDRHTLITHTLKMFYSIYDLNTVLLSIDIKCE